MLKLTKTEELADRLHSTAIHLLRQVRVQDAATGLAPARLSALSVLVFGGAMSLNELAKAEQVRPPTMSRIVDALESEGLVRRTVNQHDRRAVVLEATEKGTAILWQGRKRRVKFLAKHLSRLSEEERTTVDDAIRAIQKAMARNLDKIAIS
jgi:DNA-binding MarR family transcriptional regulator